LYVQFIIDQKVQECDATNDAIESAANLAGLEDYRIKEYPVFQNPLQKMITDLVDPGNSGVQGIMKTEIPQIMRFWQVV